MKQAKVLRRYRFSAGLLGPVESSFREPKRPDAKRLSYAELDTQAL